jgi:CheY-like chemotaxis protein
MKQESGRVAADPRGKCLAVELGPDGALTYVDPTWVEVFADGRVRLGMVLADLLDDDDRPALRMLTDDLARGRVPVGEARGRLVDARGPVTVRLERARDGASLSGLAEVIPLPASSREEEAPGRPSRVLVVEDHAINRMVATTTLAKLGCEVDHAADGQEAVDRFEAAPFDYDLVLMDCQMPVLDGYDATRRIRAIEAGRRHVPIVAVTAHAMPGDRERCLDAGMDGYLTKPLRQGDLERLVRQHRPRTSASAASAPARLATRDLDAVALEDRLGGDRELVAELVALLRATVPDTLRRVDDCLAGHDLAGLRETAHMLAGAIANFCAPSAEASASALLAAARSDDAAEAARARDAFVAAWSRLEPLLAELAARAEE